MTPVPPPPTSPARLLDPYVLGTLCGLASAGAYTCANAFLRAVHEYDPFWVSAVKALPTVLVLGPVVGAMLLKGQRVWPSLPRLGAIIVGGLVAQVGGNASFQWALGEIGIALAVPLTLGGMIVAAALLGRVLLYEPVTPRALLALTCLLAAIAILSLGADDARRSVAESAASPWRLAAGVGAACGSGLAYAILNVILRYHITRGASLPVTLLIIAFTGTVSLAAIAWQRLGSDQILATPPAAMVLMLGAGLCNTVAFIALTKSLQLTSIVYVNALNATQATMAALVGVLVFSEALSPWLAVGTGLTIGGLMLLAKAHRAMQRPGGVE